MNCKAIAVVPGPRTSFLDHLIPLCHLMEIPLHCTDEWVEACATHFYPKTPLVKGDLSDYETFYTVEPCRLYENCVQFGQQIHKGARKTIAGFHGNPVKFRDAFWIERYVHEDIVLIYGNYLADYFKEKGAWERLKKTVRIGNLRYVFYQQHKPFFDRIVKPHLLNSKRRTILWAPTWSYGETVDDSPFFAIYEEVLHSVPEEYQLLIKPHPYMFRLYPDRMRALQRFESEQIRLISEIPIIYPILNQVDIFLGDYSSVAYDFLSFNRPIYFFGQKRYTWGETIENPKRLFQELAKPDRLASERKEAYEYAFDSISLEEIKMQLIPIARNKCTN